MKKIIRFLVTGGISTSIDFIIYMIVSNYININIAKIISMTIASVYGFFANKKWTFSNKEKTNLNQISKYIFGQVVNITVNTTTNYIVFELTGIKILSFIIATGVAMIVNYLFQNYIVFKEEEK